MADATAAMGGRLLAGEGSAGWEGAVVDSRRIAGRELFFALPGEHTDGHSFVTSALDRGAGAAVIHQPVEASGTGGLILVDDAYEALHDLTRHVRQRLPQRMIGVTGSAGKTTTKELLARMMATRYDAAGSPGNLNNTYGFPLALLAMPEGLEWMVAEMGMSTPGELSKVSLLGRPDVVVLTNIRPAHLESFGSVRAIAEAKAEILDGLSDDGLVIANADDAEVMRVVARHGGRVVTFGLSPEADHCAVALEPQPGGGTRFTWKSGVEHETVELPLLGTYNVENFLAAAACAAELGIPRESVVRSAEGAAPETRRGQVHQGRHATVVDDSYNSNPAALESALCSAKQLPGSRHWAILGSMLELGGSSEVYHRDLGERAFEEGFEVVFGVGAETRPLVEAFRRRGGRGAWFECVDEVVAQALAELQAGDVVLVKGSRGIALETVAEALIATEGDD